jgi:hypothetical protein
VFTLAAHFGSQISYFSTIWEIFIKFFQDWKLTSENPNVIKIRDLYFLKDNCLFCSSVCCLPPSSFPGSKRLEKKGKKGGC